MGRSYLGLFVVIFVFSSQLTSKIGKNCRWLDSNRISLVLGATALPNELPDSFKSKRQNSIWLQCDQICGRMKGADECTEYPHDLILFGCYRLPDLANSFLWLEMNIRYLRFLAFFWSALWGTSLTYHGYLNLVYLPIADVL